MNKRFWTRQDVANQLDLSADIVRKNEKRWNLDTARVEFNKRLIRYDSRKVTLIFKSRGWA